MTAVGSIGGTGSSPLEALLAGLQEQLKVVLAQLGEAMTGRRYVEVIELEERAERLTTAITHAADRLYLDGGMPSA